MKKINLTRPGKNASFHITVVPIDNSEAAMSVSGVLVLDGADHGVTVSTENIYAEPDRPASSIHKPEPILSTEFTIMIKGRTMPECPVVQLNQEIVVES